MRLPWKLKRLLRLMLGEDKILNKASFRPDFSAESFNHLLSTTIPEFNKKEVTPEDIVNFFLRNETKVRRVLFGSPSSVHQKKHLISDETQKELIELADKMSSVAFPVYQQRLAPLNKNFLWHDLKKGAHNDQLYMSRPQRFGFAPIFAQAALFESRYITHLHEILLSWQDYAKTSKFRWPYNSSHALVYRVCALIVTWQFIASIAHHEHSNNDADKINVLLFEILNILKNDILYLAPILGNAHSNNHLLADYFVGWLIYTSFPELIPSEYDFSIYEKLWQEELLKQFYEDGGCFEHSMHYHEHGCEMALIYRLMCDEVKLPEVVNHRIKNMLLFQNSLNGFYNKPWALGDTTEDTLIPLDETMGWSSATFINAAQYFYDNNSHTSGQVFDHKSIFLMPYDTNMESQNEGSFSEYVFNVFPDSGLVNWLDKDTKSEVLFRTGVIENTQYMPGHMHADSLSLYWRIKGIDILAASGTYSYKFAQTDGINLRDYFCGANSHSKVVIDNKDPLGKLLGDFRDQDNNLRVSQKSYGKAEQATLVESQINSDNEYNGLCRSVLKTASSNYLIIDQLTELQIKQSITTQWYFDTAITPVITDNEIQCFHHGKMLSRLLCAKAENDTPQLSLIDGWQSEEYGCLQKNKIVTVNFKQPEETRVTLLTQDHTIKTCKVMNENNTASIEIIYAQHKEIVHYSHNEKSVFTIDGLTFEAKVVIHQLNSDNSQSIEIIECYSIKGNPEILHPKACLPAQLRIEKSINSQEWALI